VCGTGNWLFAGIKPQLSHRRSTLFALVWDLQLGDKPDALHLACAQHYRCKALWTNDDRLAQASHGQASNVLR
jgi:predicted nucleic acid-binding protein